MQKLLIADGSQVWISALTEPLGQRFEIRSCSDGRKLSALLTQWQPDILILHLALPYIDGLTVLQNTAFRPPVILAITMHLSRYLERTVASLGIDYTLVSPSVATLLQRLDDLLQSYSLPNPTDLTAAVTHHLQLLGIPSHLDGYRQLCTALPMFADNPHQLLTKELYPSVAACCGCSDSRAVEHSIRKAIRAAWKKKDNAIWRKYFPFGSEGRIECPSNKEFLCRLAEVLNADTP